MEEKCNHCGEMCHINDTIFVDDVTYCVNCAEVLISTGSTLWENEAIKRIADFLSENLSEKTSVKYSIIS